jgi:superfamily II DNA or RNA helicase
VTILEDLKAGASVRGLSPDGLAEIVQVEWYGNQAVNVTFRDAVGAVKQRLVYRADEPTLEVAVAGRPWSFDGDGALLRLVSEAYRIRLAHLFDPYLAIHTSRIEALPHQITAVYGEMLPRQPLRFLLADDPGAGKTIMAGLLIKELAIRGDLERCLVVAPGSLVEQWQDELSQKFGLAFDILTRDQIETARTGNPFSERSLWIARLDMLSRDPELQARLRAAKEWDLVICDEAHRMAASYTGGEVKYTKRYQLGQVLGTCCRHLLLMTATPHNGKEEDFQLFMALLDGDRFEGKFRDGVHQTDAADLMRRLTKEELLKFDGTPLFPERRAMTVKYELSAPEAALYAAVTNYVREEMNRADRFADGDEKRKQNVGFALQILQRRLASSPAAIHESLRRRRERLENRLAEERLLRRGAEAQLAQVAAVQGSVPDDLEDLEDTPEEEIETIEETVVDQATAARTIAELEAEIDTLKRLEERARQVRRAGTDAKWTQLNSILDDPLMVDANGTRRKLIIFTEPRDTLTYLADKIRTRLGRPEAVVVVHGGVGREDRRKVIEAFMHDKEVLVLVANDACGEGVNLQRAHLMVNYDLPWNPNRIEQRFGRIHRIGQTEVCHLWNLVAADTREGEVYARLLDKLETARAALGGRVYDVLGRLFEARALRELLMEAIRYGELPEVRAALFKAVDNAVDRQRIIDLLEERALVRDTMDVARVAHIREEMERAAARRLQPHFIRSFFLEAFHHLGGRASKRESGRWEITRVPGPLRERDRQIGIGAVVLDRYERICFEKDRINEPPVASFVCPGHPLLDATIDVILERYRDLLKRGAVLVDDNDSGEQIRVLFYLEHAIQDGRVTRSGEQQVVSQRLQFVEIDQNGVARDAGPAPYLDYRPIAEAEKALITDPLKAGWLTQDIEVKVMRHAIEQVIPRHVEEVKTRRLPEIDKVEHEVTVRLKREISYWDHRAQNLKAQERAGKTPRLNSANAEARANELSDRLQRRLAELNRERTISALPPLIRGGAIVVPIGLIRQTGNDRPAPKELSERDVEVERLAMEAVMAAERALGFDPRDISALKVGYDIESREQVTGRLRFIEVKGRVQGADTITVTRNEILTALNKPDSFILGIVEVSNGFAMEPRYVRQPFQREPDFGANAVIYKLSELLARAEAPERDGISGGTG